MAEIPSSMILRGRVSLWWVRLGSGQSSQSTVEPPADALGEMDPEDAPQAARFQQAPEALVLTGTDEAHGDRVRAYRDADAAGRHHCLGREGPGGITHQNVLTLLS